MTEMVNIMRDGQVISVPLTDVFPVLSLAQRRAAIKDKIKAYGATLLNRGYHHDFGGSLGVQVLQLRDGTDDARNWLASQGSYTAAVMLGQGAALEARFRTEANETIVLSYQDGLGVLLGMQGWAASLFNASWVKQDAVETAANDAALDILEAAVETGWP